LEYYGFITPRNGIYNFEGVESLRLCLSTRARSATFIQNQLKIYKNTTVYLQGALSLYLRDELERVQRRSLRIIGLPHNYLTTLEERRSDAASRYRDTITGYPNHTFYQQIINHNKHDYNLRQRNGIKD
jgi:hypothetical protein